MSDGWASYASVDTLGHGIRKIVGDADTKLPRKLLMIRL